MQCNGQQKLAKACLSFAYSAMRKMQQCIEDIWLDQKGEEGLYGVGLGLGLPEVGWGAGEKVR